MKRGRRKEQATQTGREEEEKDGKDRRRKIKRK